MITVVGEALIDAHVDGRSMRTYPGGGPFNTAIALGRLGVPATFGGALSRDALGDHFREALTVAGVGYCGADVDAASPLALVEQTVGGDALYRFYLRGTAFEDLHGGQAPVGDALVVGSLSLALDPPGSTLEDVAVAAAHKKTLVVVDPNVRSGLVDHDTYRARLERIAKCGALFKLSRADAGLLYPGARVGDVAKRLLSLGASAVVCTDGAAGSRSWTALAMATAPATPVEVVDTIGAGDAFTAGLIARLRQHGLEPTRVRSLDADAWRGALAFANATGGAQCTRAGAWGPSAADVDRVLRSAARRSTS
jgi:fructokinase